MVIAIMLTVALLMTYYKMKHLYIQQQQQQQLAVLATQEVIIDHIVISNLLLKPLWKAQVAIGAPIPTMN